MYVEDGVLTMSPSDLVVYLESEFASWMDRWALDENPAALVIESGQTPDDSADLNVIAIPDEDDLQTLLFAKKGIQHELAFLEDLKQQAKQIVEIGRENSAFDATTAAIKEGADFIYQARLETPGFGGWADFLVKRDGASDVGSHHYEPWDTKLARSPRAHFIIQLCAYSDMLEEIQGRQPSSFEIILGDGTRPQFSIKY